MEPSYKEYLLEIEQKFQQKVSSIKTLGGDGSQKKFFAISLQNKPKSYILMDLNTNNTATSKAKDSDWFCISKSLEQTPIKLPQIFYIFQNKQTFVLENCGQKLLSEEINKKNEDTLLQKDLLEQGVDIISSFLSLSNDSGLWTQRKFDTHLLKKELFFFKTHFLDINKNQYKNFYQEDLFQEDSDILCQFIENYSSFFTHRDYHSRNILVHEGDFVVIDFQDARLGPASYDLVSFCFDPYLNINYKFRKNLLEESIYSFSKELPKKTVENILESWKAVALQRLLKAIGSFAYLGKKAGKQYFYQYITPSIELLANLDLHNENWPYLSQTLIKGLKNATNQ